MGSLYSAQICKNIDNPFWHDVLKIFVEFQDSLKLQNDLDISTSPLWFNKSIKTKFIKNWYLKGIRQISDIISPEGNIIDFQVAKRNYGIKGTILDWERLKRAIPNELKQNLKSVQNGQIINNPSMPISLTKLLKQRKGCSHIYKIFYGKIQSERRKKQKSNELEKKD